MYRFECQAKIIITTMEEKVTVEEMARIALNVENELNDVVYYESIGAGKIGIRVHIDGNSLPKEVIDVQRD
jgi:hypothetical protein